MQDDLILFKKLFADIDLYELFFEYGEDNDQSLSGMVIGYKMDNAFGNHVDADAVVGGWQELVIRLETYNNGRDDKKFVDARFNLANLIAIIRANSTAILNKVRDSGRCAAIVNAIMYITRDCRPDMHEPDNQSVGAEIASVGREVSYRYTEERNDVEFVLFREIDHGPRAIHSPTAARAEVRFNVRDLIMMITKI